MLKKLVKYGNSNALVLDKPILELLEIEEGSLVRIKTDGKSIIITPHAQPVAELVSTTLDQNEVRNEAAAAAMVAKFGGHLQSLEKAQLIAEMKKKLNEMTQAAMDFAKNPEKMQQVQQNMQALMVKYNLEGADMLTPGNTTQAAMQDAFKQLHMKYHDVYIEMSKVFENVDYLHEMQLLAERYKAGVLTTEQYFKAGREELYKYIPEMRACDAEMAALAAKFSTKS